MWEKKKKPQIWLEKIPKIKPKSGSEFDIWKCVCGEGCCFKSPFLRGPVGVGLFWLFLVHLIIITQMLFSLFSRRGGVLLSERVRVWIRNGCCLRSPFFGGVYFGCFWCIYISLSKYYFLCLVTGVGCC